MILVMVLNKDSGCGMELTLDFGASKRGEMRMPTRPNSPSLKISGRPSRVFASLHGQRVAITFQAWRLENAK
jgi:hypothetical protein